MQCSVQNYFEGASKQVETGAARDHFIVPECLFVPGRLITDNVLLAYELTHYLNHRKWGKNGVAAIKLDMSKAYDRVEWMFLEKMMTKLGFF